MPGPGSPSSDQPSEAAWDACRAICRHHAKSFFFASIFLPKQKRRQAYAVYSFCRGIDDAVDTGDPATVGERLAAFAAGLDAIYTGKPPESGNSLTDEQRLALEAFAWTVRTCEIPKQYFLDLAEGCRADLVVHRYANWAELERYCYLVAGVVGLIMCRVFGLKNQAALAQAVQMGNAMQLTNILRDVKEDSERGRIYLPADEMAAYDVTERDIAGGHATENFVSLMRFQIARTRQLYVAAAGGLGELEADGSRQTACAMAVVYAGILRAIEQQNYDVFARRARVPFGNVGKLLRVPRALRLSRRGDVVSAAAAFDVPQQ